MTWTLRGDQQEAETKGWGGRVTPAVGAAKGRLQGGDGIWVALEGLLAGGAERASHQKESSRKGWVHLGNCV